LLELPPKLPRAKNIFRYLNLAENAIGAFHWMTATGEDDLALSKAVKGHADVAKLVLAGVK
jgi:hypothetical protein